MSAELRIKQNLAQIDQLLDAMDILSQLVERLRDETDALLKEAVV